MLEMIALTFKNPETGKEITVHTLEQLRFKLPNLFVSDDDASAQFWSAAISMGAYNSIVEKLPNKK